MGFLVLDLDGASLDRAQQRLRIDIGNRVAVLTQADVPAPESTPRLQRWPRSEPSRPWRVASRLAFAERT